MASLSIRVEPFYAYVLEVIDQIDELSATPDGEAIPLTELKFGSFLAKASVIRLRMPPLLLQENPNPPKMRLLSLKLNLSFMTGVPVLVRGAGFLLPGEMWRGA